MSAGVFDYDPDSPPASTPATAVEVLRYDGSSYEPMPNIQVLDVQKREGLEPMTAHLAYILDDIATTFGWPAEFEDIMALASSAAGRSSDSADAGRYVVQPDERIVIRTVDGDGDADILFDGFAQAPQASFNKGRQQVSFVAVGVAIRLYDRPVMDFRQAWGGLMADQVPSASEYQGVVQAAVRFNPEGVGNCTPESNWYKPEASDAPSFPLFYENARVDRGESVTPVPWTLANAVRYLLCYHLAGSDFVAFPDLGSLDALLNRRMPKDQDPFGLVDPALFYDPDDPKTYIDEPIVLNDFDATGMHWPEALESLLAFSGFAAEMTTRDRGDGAPVTYLNVYRKDAAGPYDPKTIGLQPRRDDLQAGASEIESFGVVRDYKDAFNAVTMDVYPALFEVSVVLAMKGPADAISEGDKQAYNASGEHGSSPRFRGWFADELGEGHVDRDGATNTDPFDFTGVFAALYKPEDDEPNDDDPPADEDEPAPVRRTRPPLADLISRDDDGEVRPAALWLSRDYAGDTAKPWDGTGTWQAIPHGWELSSHRLGIKITADNLEAWPIGEPSGEQSKGPVVRVITSMTEPNDANPRFFLRLDCVIEADVRGYQDLPSRRASALKWDRYRYLGGKTSYRRKYTHESSPYFADAGGSPDAGKASVSDTDAEKAGYTWMAQVQAAGENPSIAGPITIPWHTREYQIGDRIAAIDGRDLSLQVNQGTDNGEAPAFPFVVGVSWSFGDKESTTLDLSDHRALPNEDRS